MMNDPVTSPILDQENPEQQTIAALKAYIQTLQEKIASVESKNQFLQATVDALAPSTVVLAPVGQILYSNSAWQKRCWENGCTSPTAHLGENYLAICPQATGMSATEMTLAAAGIQTVVTGQQPEFTLEYAQHTDAAGRWFVLRVTPFAEAAPCRVVVSHVDITDHKQAQEAERAQRCFAEALRDSLAALTNSLDVDHVMGQILTAAATVVPTEAGSIILFEEEQARLAYVRGFTPETEAGLKDYYFPRESLTLAGRLTQMQPYLVADTQKCASWIPLPRTEWIRSSIGVPITIRGKTIGLLVADSATPYHLQPQDVEKLQAFAHYASLTLENAYHVSHLEQRVVERTIALAEERNLLRTLIDAIPDVIYVKDTAHRFVLRNQAETLLLPTVTPADLIGKTAADFFVPAEAETMHAEERAIFATGQPLLHRELMVTRNDGSKVWVSLSKVPLRNLQGEIIGLAGILHDISQRKHDEEQLRFYASLQENVNDAVITTDLEFRIRSWNRAAETIYGWSASEILGKSVQEVLHTYYPSEEARQQTREELFQRGYGSGEVLQHRKDGTPLYILYSVTLLKDQQGAPYGIVAVNHDITELRRTAEALREQRDFLQQVIDGVPDLILVKDQTGQVLWANQNSARIAGLTPALMVGKRDSELLGNFEESNAFRAQMQAILLNGQPVVIPEEMIQGCPYQVTQIPLKSRGSTYDRLLVVSTDITRHKASEAALQQALQKEKELSELKSRFLSMASHEFRTPLTTILVLAETLSAYRHKLNDEQVTQRMDTIRYQVEHLKLIMDDVLQLSQLQAGAGRGEFNPSALNLHDLCTLIVEELQIQPEVAPRLRYLCHEAIPAIYADHRLMRQVVSNLVTNALKYSDAPKVVHLSLTRCDQMLVLQVQDEGIGIPAADVPHLFQPFHRAGNVGRISGTGLGLVITKEAVERHGGTITVESQVGVGTTFTVMLPIELGDSASYTAA